MAIHNNTFNGNVSFGVQNTNNTVVVDAQDNFWGDNSGPLDADVPVGGLNDNLGLSNPSGLGDAVTDFVDYFPWVGLTPEDLLQELIDCVIDLELNMGIETGLTAKLEAELASLENDRPAAVMQIEAFINQVEAIRKQLGDPEADELISKAQDVIAAINALP